MIRPVLRIEAPEAGITLAPGARLGGHGYVLSPSRVAEITVFIGGLRLCAGAGGLARPDVTDAHPDAPELRPEGFAFSATLPASLPAGPAELVVIARTSTGESRSAVAVTIAGAAGTAGTVAAPEAAAPQGEAAADALLFTVDDAALSPDGVLLVRGWALGRSAIERVELVGLRGVLGTARLGLPRDDVAAANPGYPEARLAGFGFERFVDAADLGKGGLRVVIHAAGLAPRVVEAPVRLLPAQDAAPEPASRRSAAPSQPPMQLRLEAVEVSGAGILRLRGWVVGLAPIDQIRVHLDDRLLGIAEKGVSRTDVGEAFPDYPDSVHGGFLLQHALEDDTRDGQTLKVTALMAGGITRQATEILRLPGPVRRGAATSDTTVHFHCDEVTLTEAGEATIKGWACCASGVTAITVELDGEVLGETRTGGDRPDVGNHYPAIPSARQSGFHFAGRTTAAVSGEQVLRLVVQGKAGEQRVVLLPVLATPVIGAGSAGTDGGGGIRFYLDLPQVSQGPNGLVANETVRGFLSLAGWALAPAGIANVEVFVDGVSLGEAYYGIRREDIGAAFPSIESALTPGFAMLVPPQVLPRGRHDLRVLVRDKAGASTEIAFAVEAEPATDSPGPWQLRAKLPQSELDLSLAIAGGAGVRPGFAWRLGLRAADELDRLALTLASLRRQAYPDWSLEIVTPAEADHAAWRALALADEPEIAGRVRFVSSAEPPPDRADLFHGPLSPGDVLGADALLELAVAAAMHPGCDFLYSDERRVDPSDGEMKAYFKPDWAPDLLLSANYIGRLWAARGDLVARAGIAAEGGCEYDQVLRLTEQAGRVVHVGRVLCERGRRVLDSVPEERAALRAALQRRGIRGAVEPGCLPGIHRARRRVTAKGLVSIIIPTMATRGLINICLDSIRAHSTYRNFEFVVLDNIPEDNPAAKAWLRDNADVILQIREKFNWSRFNNKGAAAAKGEFLLFLNDDIEVLAEHPDWLECLLEHAQRPEIGVVGPQLLYPDRKVQHAGMFLAEGVARHAFRFLPADAPGPFGLARTQRNVSAVTGACLLTRRDVFDALGGFDEKHAVINNDLDYCLRTQASGRRVIYTPHTTLIHHEMVSRARLRDIYNVKSFARSWRGAFLKGDPYFNPRLSSDYDDFVPEAEPTSVVHVGHPVIAREAVRRVLAVKLDHIGDFIAAMPALRRLKQVFPNAELHVLAARTSVALAALEPAIDRMHEFGFFFEKSSKGKRKLAQKELVALQERLEPLHFDLAVDLRRQGDTRHVLQHSGATWLAGFDQRYQFPFLDIAIDWEGDFARHSKRAHVGDALMQFVESIAIACGANREVISQPETLAEARARIAALPAIAAIGPVLFERRLICIHPGAGNENKQWPAGHFAGLIDLLVEEQDANIILIGGPDEVVVAEEVRSGVMREERVFVLAGKTRLGDLPHVLRACELYVGNDSGPKHMAAALGVPTVGIHSGSVDAVEWGPVGRAAVALRRDMTCSPCYLSRLADCHRNLACMRGLKPGDVYRACLRLLALPDAEPERRPSP